MRLIDSYCNTKNVDFLQSLADDVLLTLKRATADVDNPGVTLQKWAVRRAVTRVSHFTEEIIIFMNVISKTHIITL